MAQYTTTAAHAHWPTEASSPPSALRRTTPVISPVIVPSSPTVTPSPVSAFQRLLPSGCGARLEGDDYDEDHAGEPGGDRRNEGNPEPAVRVRSRHASSVADIRRATKAAAGETRRIWLPAPPVLRAPGNCRFPARLRRTVRAIILADDDRVLLAVPVRLPASGCASGCSGRTGGPGGGIEAGRAYQAVTRASGSSSAATVHDVSISRQGRRDEDANRTHARTSRSTQRAAFCRHRTNECTWRLCG
jgi:hypothetical protein